MGLRRSEICALKIDDLEGDVLCVHRAAVYNEDGEVVNKEYPKTPGSFRYIRLPETLAKKNQGIRGNYKNETEQPDRCF